MFVLRKITGQEHGLTCSINVPEALLGGGGADMNILY